MTLTQHNETLARLGESYGQRACVLLPELRGKADLAFQASATQLSELNTATTAVSRVLKEDFWQATAVDVATGFFVCLTKRGSLEAATLAAGRYLAYETASYSQAGIRTWPS